LGARVDAARASHKVQKEFELFESQFDLPSVDPYFVSLYIDSETGELD